MLRAHCMVHCWQQLHLLLQCGAHPGTAVTGMHAPAPMRLPLSCALLQHGTSITLPAINKVVNRRRNAELLELMLGSGLPLPAVPLGSEEESVTMFFGEYDTTESVSRGREGKRCLRSIPLEAVY